MSSYLQENSLKNYHLFNALAKENKTIIKPCTKEAKQHLFNVIKSKISNWDSMEESNDTILQNKISGFCSTLNKKWNAANRTKETFIKKNEEWLNLNFNYSLSQTSSSLVPSTSFNSVSTPVVGRPIKNFLESSERTKRRKIQNFLIDNSKEKIIYAAKNILYATGNHAGADLLKQSTENSPTRALKIKQAFKNSKNKNILPYTDDEALALIVDTNLTKNSYIIMKKGAKQRNADIYPSYDKIKIAKSKCYPKNIKVSEFSATLPLQDLVDHTTERLIESLNLNRQDFEGFLKIDVHFKWGCDGSSGHSEYHQKVNDKMNINEVEENKRDVEDESSEEVIERVNNESLKSDGSLFLVSLVPLRLEGTKENDEKLVFWENSKSSSTRYCRPIKFINEKETIYLIKREVEKIENEIRHLKPLKLFDKVDANFHFYLTMVDGKVINSLCNISSQTCFICKCTPKDINNLEKIKSLPCNENNFKYGLSPLHAWIKCLELMLHISYKKGILESNKRATALQKSKITDRKKEIQDSLWKNLGIKVDKVVQGKGTSNTGNVARRFFENHLQVSEITKLDERLLERFKIILSILACSCEIDYKKFDEYAQETTQLYLELYRWYRMPPSVHKILIHGSKFIELAPFPIGIISEEAQEAKNKDYMKIRRNHTRKSSRVNTNLDLFHSLLISSDPLITSKSSIKQKIPKQLCPEALNLLKVNHGSSFNKNLSEDLISSFETLTTEDETSTDSD